MRRALVGMLVTCATAQAQDLLDKAPGATPFAKAEALYAQGTQPSGPADVKGWFAGRWVEADLPRAKGSLLGIEGVPSKREDPASAEVLILATWSDMDATSWDAAKPAELARTKDMLRRGPRDGAVVFDAGEKAAVILGKYDDGKFRYTYGIRRLGESVVIKYDYEHRRVSYGVFHRKIE